MTDVFDGTKKVRHPEERLKGASRRTHGRYPSGSGVHPVGAKAEEATP